MTVQPYFVTLEAGNQKVDLHIPNQQFVMTNGFDAPQQGRNQHERTITITQYVRGSTPSDVHDYRNTIDAILSECERHRYGGQLYVKLGTQAAVRFHVLFGQVDIAEFYPGVDLRLTIILECLADAYGAPIPLPESSTLTNADVWEPPAIHGVEPALPKLIIEDESINGKAINRFRISRKSGRSHLPSDFAPVLDTSVASGASTSGGYARRQMSGAWQAIATAEMPTDKPLSRGAFDVYTMARDNAPIVGTPRSVTAEVTTENGMPDEGVDVERVQAAAGSGVKTLELGLPSPVTPGNMLAMSIVTNRRTIERVQYVGAAFGIGPSRSLEWPDATTQGNLLILLVKVGISTGTTAPEPAVPPGWQLAISRMSPNENVRVHLYYKSNAATESGEVVVTVNDVDNPQIAMGLMEYSGIKATSPLDQTGSSNALSATVGSGSSGTLSQENSLAIGLLGYMPDTGEDWSGGFSSGFDTVDRRSEFAVAELVADSTSSVSTSHDVTGSVQWAGCIATFVGETAPTPQVTGDWTMHVNSLRGTEVRTRIYTQTNAPDISEPFQIEVEAGQPITAMLAEYQGIGASPTINTGSNTGESTTGSTGTASSPTGYLRIGAMGAFTDQLVVWAGDFSGAMTQFRNRAAGVWGEEITTSTLSTARTHSLSESLPWAGAIIAVEPAGAPSTPSGLSPGVYEYVITALDGSSNTSLASFRVGQHIEEYGEITPAWSAPLGGNPGGGYRLYWRRVSSNLGLGSINWRIVNVGGSTSYTHSSETAGSPSTPPIGTTLHTQLRLRVGLSSGTVLQPMEAVVTERADGETEFLRFGTVHLPPEVQAEAAREGWYIVIEGLNEILTPNMDIHLSPGIWLHHHDEDQFVATYHGMGLTTPRTWEMQAYPDGTASVILRDGTGDEIGRAIADGKLSLGTGAGSYTIMAEAQDGEADVVDVKFKVSGASEYQPAYRSLAGRF